MYEWTTALDTGITSGAPGGAPRKYTTRPPEHAQSKQHVHSAYTECLRGKLALPVVVLFNLSVCAGNLISLVRGRSSLQGLFSVCFEVLLALLATMSTSYATTAPEV